MADEKKVELPKTFTGEVRFAMLALAAIVIAAVFGVSIYPTTSLHTYLPADKAAQALYVCPAAIDALTQVSKFMQMYRKQFAMAIAFFLVFGGFMAMWNLYQNLLKDKLDRKSWDWFLKFMLPFMVVVLIAWRLLLYTPNHFREVRVAGSASHFVLCEASVPGSRPVLGDKVSTARRDNP
ncbi:MAG: hypothetical protein LBB23_02650 [Rickettsiales bacterium]|jgi:hypothetical protein|nr:hypothetical protein [Rickettsiales bacterium]